MDPVLAALNTHPLIARARGLPPHDPAIGRDHLADMVRQMESWDITDRKVREKAMRWLGYIQGCVVAGGGATLDELKKINKES